MRRPPRGAAVISNQKRGRMRTQAFLDEVATRAEQELPDELRASEQKIYRNLLKIHYGVPKIHYEVWVRGKKDLIEIGLHFEADRELNFALLEHFSERFIRIRAQLGDGVEPEDWTRSWARVHETVSYESLDEDLAGEIGGKLGRMITVLQPILEAAMEERFG